MDKPYDIITEIKSENEVKVTGKGPTNYPTRTYFRYYFGRCRTVGGSLVKGKNGVVLEGNFTPQEAHNWVSHCCTILKENFDADESNLEVLSTKKVHSVLFQISHEVMHDQVFDHIWLLSVSISKSIKHSSQKSRPKVSSRNRVVFFFEI